jgi:hypothetical protein
MAMDDSDFRNAPDTTTEMEFEWGANYEYYVDTTVEWSYEGHDGIGSYEYHGSKEYHQGDPVFEIESVKFTVWDENSNEIELPQDEKEKILQYIYDNAEPNFD